MKSRKILLRIIKPILKIVIILCLYQIACIASDKVIINDLIYFRLIHSVKQVSGENLKYEKCYSYKDENGNHVFIMYFDDWTSGKDEYKATLLELRAIQERFEIFLEDNPNYFSEGCKIEITTKLSRKNASISNYIGETIYSDFVKLHILTSYSLENVAECFGNVKYLYYGLPIDNVEVITRFSDLDTLAVGFSFDDEELELVKSLCPKLEIVSGFEE